VLELGILTSLLSKMGTLEAVSSSLSLHQLDGRAGGPLLRRETTNFGVVSQVNRKASRILRATLSVPDIGLPLLVLISQVRNTVVYKTETSHIKFIGNLYDTCNTTLQLLLEFIATAPEENDETIMAQARTTYAALLPEMTELVSADSYNVDPELSFAIVRPLISAALTTEIKEKRKAVEAMEEGAEGAGAEGATKEHSNALSSWLPKSESMRAAYKSMLPPAQWSFITPELYVRERGERMRVCIATAKTSEPCPLFALCVGSVWAACGPRFVHTAQCAWAHLLTLATAGTRLSGPSRCTTCTCRSSGTRRRSIG